MVSVAIILLAAFLRLYRLPYLPPGLNFDEAGNGVAALDILHGAPVLWWRIGGGKEPLWPYLLAAAIFIWGNIPLILRLLAAWIGILTVAAVFPLTYRLLRGPRHLNQARLTALLAMTGLAVSGWHLHFSRLGFRAVLLPLLSTLAFYFLWRAVSQLLITYPDESGQHFVTAPALHAARFPLHALRSLLLSALFLALAIYAYLAARLLPLVPILFWVVYWLIRYLRTNLSRGAETTASISPLRFRPLGQLLVALLVFLLPLIFYFVINPADFVARSTTVSIFNPEWHNGNLPGTVWGVLIATLGTFVSLTGDPNPLVNLPGQAAIPAILAPFLVLGVAISLYRAGRASASHQFLLCWWVVTIVPAILAPEGAPHHLRLIGAIVPTHIFLAIGLATAITWLVKLFSLAPVSPLSAVRLAYLLPAICYLLVVFQTFTHYFIDWPAQSDFTLPFDLYAVRLADDIAQTPPEMIYVLPMDIRAGREARHYTLDFLLADHPAGYLYLPVDERNAETGLTQAAAGREQLRVVRWSQDKHREADAKEIVTFLLETQARPVGHDSFPVYDVETYAMPAGPEFQLPAIDRPIGVSLDGLLRLDAAFVPSTAIPGDWLPVALALSPQAPLDVDYKASLRLIGPGGERVAQKDRLLLHNFHQGTSLWPPETVNEYYLIPVPSDVVPGNYTVSVVIYEPDTQAPLIADGLVEVPLGQVRID